MRRVPSSIVLGLALLLSGCVGAWREQSYMDQHAYTYTDTTTFQGDLTATIEFLKSIGLKPIPDTASNMPMTEMVLIRNMGDHFHENVTVRGLGDHDTSGELRHRRRRRD